MAGAVPRVHRPILRHVGALGLRVLGWRISGALPNLPKFVIVVAPHTSNWDFAIAFLAYLALELRVSWLGKHSIFGFPFGPVLRHFGGIPVRRGSPQNLVDRSVAEFQKREAFVLVLAPEGTRRRVGTWRSGFHRIALGAGVPIVPASLDFATRQIEIGPAYQPTGHYATDLTHLTERFARVTPRHPHLYDPSPRP